MKSKVFVICILLLSSFVFAEDVTFDDLLQLQGSQDDEIYVFLTAKDWRYSGANNDEKSGYQETIWSYAPIKKDAPVHWISIFRKGDAPLRVSYMFGGEKLFAAMTQSLKAKTFILIDEEVTDASLFFVYSDTKMTVTVLVERRFPTPWYCITIYDKKDYITLGVKNHQK